MRFKNSSVGLCCKDCKERYLGCHDRCETFKAAKQAEKDKRTQIKEQASIDNEWISYKSKVFDERGKSWR